MWEELLVGAVASAVNICIHALVMTAVIKSARAAAARAAARHHALFLMASDVRDGFGPDGGPH
jgi:hypothetical protein